MVKILRFLHIWDYLKEIFFTRVTLIINFIKFIYKFVIVNTPKYPISSKMTVIGIDQ